MQSSDVVITMGCGDTCPYFPGVAYRDWKLDDPAGQPVDVVRRIRDDIAARVRALIDELLPQPHQHRTDTGSMIAATRRPSTPLISAPRPTPG